MEIISKIYLSLSHAAAYSFVAYRTAYLKCHYMPEYFAALMSSMMDSASKISMYTAECKKNAIKILPPSVNYSGKNFTPQRENIRFGLMAIKNLGAGLIEKLISERETNGLYTSMYDFCLRNYSREFNRKALEGLIKSGALDGLGENRRQMLYNIDGVIAAVETEKKYSSEGQLDLFDEMDSPNVYEPKKMEEMSKELKLALEKEATGLYLSGHPMDKFASFVKNARLTTVADIVGGKFSDGKRVSIGGIIDSLKVRQLKNGNLLATAIVEDITASIPITIFAKAYAEYKHLLSDSNPIILTGRITEREDRETEIIAERLELIPESAANVTVNAEKKFKEGLYLKINNTENENFSKIKGLLSNYKGIIPVYIYCTDTKRKLEAPRELWINGNEMLISDICKILGEENVKFIK